MAVLSAVVLQSKEVKGGRNKIRISVAHNGETRYIVTDIVIDSPKEWKNGSVVKRPDATMLNTKIRGLLQRYQSALDELDYIEGLTCAELVFQLKTGGCRRNRTLKSVYEEYVANTKLRENTVAGYRYMWSAISKVIGEKLLVEHINHSTVCRLDKTLKDRDLSAVTIKNIIVLLKTVINYAKQCGYVQFRIDPFVGYKLPATQPRDSWVTVDQVRRIRDIDIKKKNIIKCRDLWMLSYYLGGINMTDLLDINFNEHPNVLHYIRKKTSDKPKFNKYVEFAIPEEAKAIIEKYKDSDGRLAASPIQRKYKMAAFFEFNMKKLAALTGIPNLIYYSARKSFSQHAFELGIGTSVIDYILGHKVDKGGSSLYNYISVTPELATAAVRKVLDNLK